MTKGRFEEAFSSLQTIAKSNDNPLPTKESCLNVMQLSYKQVYYCNLIESVQVQHV